MTMLARSRPHSTLRSKRQIFSLYSLSDLALDAAKVSHAKRELRPLRFLLENGVTFASALRAELGRLGVQLGEANLVDGSGLSTQNRVSPRMLVKALEVGRRHDIKRSRFVRERSYLVPCVDHLRRRK